MKIFTVHTLRRLVCFIGCLISESCRVVRCRCGILRISCRCVGVRCGCAGIRNKSFERSLHLGKTRLSLEFRFGSLTLRRGTDAFCRFPFCFFCRQLDTESLYIRGRFIGIFSSLIGDFRRLCRRALKIGDLLRRKIVVGKRVSFISFFTGQGNHFLHHGGIGHYHLLMNNYAITICHIT